METGYFISAYATSPSSERWKPLLEADYFQGLAADPRIIGIEHPFLPDSENYPLAWLAEHIPHHFSLIITALPSFMKAAKTNPLLGLASNDEAGRTAAMKQMEKLKSYTASLNKVFGRKIVKAIHFHSLPRNDKNTMRGSEAALKKSLKEMKMLDFDEAQLNLEHCDAYIPSQLADKGFLLLEEEINALGEIGKYGLVLNWARSAIEGRSVQMPLKHIQEAQKAHLLQGFFFSGCTDKANSVYGVWKDTHMPPQNSINGKYLDNDSLLGAIEIQKTLNALSQTSMPLYLGVKVSDRSLAKEISLKTGLNQETITVIEGLKKRC